VTRDRRNDRNGTVIQADSSLTLISPVIHSEEFIDDNDEDSSGDAYSALRSRHFRLGDEDQWADLAQRLRDRYRGPATQSESGLQLPVDAPQRLLVPSVDDAPIFSVRVKVSVGP
jgi:hypothetical protein